MTPSELIDENERLRGENAKLQQRCDLLRQSLEAAILVIENGDEVQPDAIVEKG